MGYSLASTIFAILWQVFSQHVLHEESDGLTRKGTALLPNPKIGMRGTDPGRIWIYALGDTISAPWKRMLAYVAGEIEESLLHSVE